MGVSVAAEARRERLRIDKKEIHLLNIFFKIIYSFLVQKLSIFVIKI